MYVEEFRAPDLDSRKYRCANCGKEFSAIRKIWGWWYGSEIVCRYNCMREMEKKDLSAQAARKLDQDWRQNNMTRIRLTKEELDTASAMRISGSTYSEIAKALDRQPNTIRMALSKLGVERGRPENKPESEPVKQTPVRKLASKPEPKPAPAPAAPDLSGVQFTPDEAALALGYDVKNEKNAFRLLLKAARSAGFRRQGEGTNVLTRYTMEDIIDLKKIQRQRDERKKLEKQPRMDLVDALRARLENV